MPEDTPPDLSVLEAQLEPISHGLQALEVIQSYSENQLRSTNERAKAFNEPGALVLPPITYSQAQECGALSEGEDLFYLLQGDVISTESAYDLGIRVTGRAKFIVANPTCNLIPGRSRKNALLFAVNPILSSDDSEEMVKIRKGLGTLLKFKDYQHMYLPPFSNDGDDVIFNVVSLDDMHVVRLETLVLAHRIASLSPLGWRIFASQLRVNFTREAVGEAAMRKTVARTLN